MTRKICLFSSFRLHSVHFQYSLNISIWNYISEWIQESHYYPKPPFITDFQIAVSFSELKLLFQKWLNIRMFCDATRAIGNIFELFFAKIVFVSFIAQTIIRMIIFLVFRQYPQCIIKTSRIKNPNHTKTDQTTILFIKNSPKLVILFIPTL